jgi:colicin import membrane protein
MSAHESGGSHRDRWLAVFLSLMVHGFVVGVLVWGWWRFRAPKAAPQQLAIEATVVTARAASPAPAPASSAPAAPPPAPAPEPAAEPATKPPPVPEAAKVDQAAAEQERTEEHRREERALREREAQERAAEAQQKAAEARRAEQEAQARKLKEAADRAARTRAEDKTRREAELQAQLAAEERVNAVRGSQAEAEWLALIRDKVTRAWIRPPSARPGVNCEVHVTQVPGGVVTGVQIGSCNGDEAVRASIEDAVNRASPLPQPSNADVFDRNLKFDFHPDE